MMPKVNVEEEKLLQQLRDTPRATPPPEVWANIERIATGGATVRTMSRADWRRTAAAAAVVLFLNTAALFWTMGRDATLTDGGDNVSLISDYQLYN